MRQPFGVVAPALHERAPEDAVSTAARIGLVVAIPTMIISGFGAYARPSSTVSDLFRGGDRVAVAQEHHVLAPTETPGRLEDPDDGAGAVDLYGNEVTNAVAKYKADGAGALYELHSPQTEVPRLASPKS